MKQDKKPPRILQFQVDLDTESSSRGRATASMMLNCPDPYRSSLGEEELKDLGLSAKHWIFRETSPVLGSGPLEQADTEAKMRALEQLARSLGRQLQYVVDLLIRGKRDELKVYGLKQDIEEPVENEDICPDCNGTGKRPHLGDQCQCCHGYGRFSIASAAFAERERKHEQWIKEQPLLWRMRQRWRWLLDDALESIGLQRI